MNVKKDFWEEAYQRNIGKMIAVCFRYVPVRQVAEDLAHDAFMTAMNKAKGFKGTGHFDAWLRKITVNTALMYIRDSKRVNDSNSEVLMHYMIDNYEEDAMWNNFTIEELLEAIKILPEHHRLVFNMYVLDGYSHKEIAKELNISAGTSKSHLARARKKLQEILAKKERKKRSALPFILFPCGLARIDRLYKKCFCNYEIAPQYLRFPTEQNWNLTAMPKFTPFANIAVYSGAGVLTAVLAGLLIYHTMNKNDTPMKQEIPPISSDSLIIQNEPLSNDFLQKADFKESADSVLENADEMTEELDTVSKTGILQKQTPIVIKKDRIIRKEVIVRDTVTIIDTTNAK
ncbi:MAG: RNA polymerase sigma factor [Bacteroidales bacterium]